MLQPQLISAVLMVILRRPQRIQMLRCPRDIDFKVLMVVDLLKPGLQRDGFLGGCCDVDLLAVRMKEVSKAFAKMSSVMVVMVC